MIIRKDNNKDKDKTKDLNIDELPINKDTVINIKIETHEYDPKECQITPEDEITEKQMKYFENQIRHSYEYKKYIQYLKTELDLNRCELLPGLDPNVDPVSIELHHFPITLYDITEAVLNKKLSELNPGESVSSFEVAEDVMKEHYENNVGLVPLTATLHEMAHNGAIWISNKIINGNYSNFIAKYRDYFSPDALQRVEDNIAASLNEENAAKNKEKLEKKIMHYDIDYQSSEKISAEDFDFFKDDDK